jgi:hypothetical protein
MTTEEIICILTNQNGNCFDPVYIQCCNCPILAITDFECIGNASKTLEAIKKWKKENKS